MMGGGGGGGAPPPAPAPVPPRPAVENKPAMSSGAPVPGAAAPGVPAQVRPMPVPMQQQPQPHLMQGGMQGVGKPGGGSEAKQSAARSTQASNGADELGRPQPDEQHGQQCWEPGHAATATMLGTRAC